MTAVATIQPASAPETRARQPVGNVDAFATLLLGAQAVSALAATGGVADASGLQPNAPDAEPDAQRARIDGETEAARTSEAQQRRGSAGEDSGGRADAVRSAREAGGAARDTQGTAAPAPNAPPSDGASTTARDAAGPVASAVDFETDGSAGADDGAPPRPPEPQTKASSPEPQPPKAEAPTVEKSTAGTAIPVPTAGAARATETAGDVKSSVAQTIARIVATSGGERADSATAPVAQADRDASTGKTAGRMPTPAHPQPSSGKSGETAAPRRAEFEQLVRMLRGNLGTRDSSATLRLDPPELGRMKVEVRMTGDVLHLRIEVASTEARDLLNERVDQLASALRAHDIRMERFEIVAVDEQNGGRQADAQASNDARDSARQAQDESGTVARRTASADAGAASDGAGDQVDFQATDTSAQLDLRV